MGAKSQRSETPSTAGIDPADLVTITKFATDLQKPRSTIQGLINNNKIVPVIIAGQTYIQWSKYKDVHIGGKGRPRSGINKTIAELTSAVQSLSAEVKSLKGEK